MTDVEKQIPNRIESLNEMLYLGKDDDVLSVLRHFDWNQ